MPYRHKDTERVYWTIGMLADELAVETSALRFWEAEGLFPSVPKGKKGCRIYNAKQRKQIQDTVFLLHFVGFTVKGFKKAYARGLVQDIISLYCPI